MPLTSNVRPIEMQGPFTALRCCTRPLAWAVRLRGRRTYRCSRTGSSPASARAVRPSAASEPLAVLGTALRWRSVQCRVVIEQSMNTNSQQSGSGSVMPLGCVSLALRSTAALGCGRAGTGFVGAASGGAFGCQGRSKLAAVRREISSRVGAVEAAAGALSVARGRLVSSWVRPNHSVERTANGGARLLAPSPTAAPLSAAHLKR